MTTKASGTRTRQRAREGGGAMEKYMNVTERGTERRRSETTKHEKEGDMEKVLERMLSKYIE